MTNRSGQFEKYFSFGLTKISKVAIEFKNWPDQK